MATVKYTAVVDMMAGKLNGTVFAKNKYCSYARSKGLPFNPQSMSQIDIREVFKSITKGWSSLTDAQRLKWDELGATVNFSNKVGDTRKYTGFNIFGSLNMNLASIGISTLTDAPSKTNVLTIPISVDVDVTPGTEDIKLSNLSAIPASQRMKVFSTGAISAGIKNPADTQYRLITDLDSTFVSGGSIKTAYNAVFGSFKKGDVIWFKAIMIDTASGFESFKIVYKSVAHI